MSVLIKRARIVNPIKNEDFVGDIFIDGERIEAIGDDLFSYVTKADFIIDANHFIAAPGLVDMHVHLRDPGYTDKEDIQSGCRAAAAGGVTALLAMPNTNPAVDSAKTVKYILNQAKNADAEVYTTACITKGIKGQKICDFQALKKAGAVALSDDGRPVLSTRHLMQALQEAQELGMIVVSHCEDLTAIGDICINEGTVSKELGLLGNHRAVEDCGTAREIAAAAAIEAPLHICHVSTKGSVDIIRDAKRRGLPITAETAPHYLLLTEEEILKKDADYKMNPPLRTEEDRKALIAALKDGTIDAIATDHAPHTPEEKADFMHSPNGSIGMETSLAATITAMDGVLKIPDIIRKMSVNPAKIMNIDAGEIKVGGLANLVLFDPNEQWIVDENKLHGKSKNTPFKGMKLKGKVKYTFFKGRKVYQDTAE
ncbi:dihydroorotase [Scatolibacter rhodanostii]|uniref:dihydroorotase n=1 Tax=Scatolibacter rhodanostii TaxID=2014781 RepID=UPI000C068C48|nr:dihydroorotase [Scatolibacter rhodanostii]